MTTDIGTIVANKYLSFSCAEQKAALLRIANWLTLVGRDTYTDPEGGLLRLRAVNEAQHRIIGQLEKLELSSSERYPDDTFAAILVEQFKAVGVGDKRVVALLEGTEPNHSDV